jgi:hypothetical protein
MTAAWEVGDILENTTTGVRRIVVRVTPAGVNGTRVSDGPVFHARVMRDGVEVPRGHTADIWQGSMSHPTALWSRVQS